MRSRWKGPVLSRTAGPRIDRRATVLPMHVGSSFEVHTGNSYTRVAVTEQMVNCKFGMFSHTRVPFSFKKK